MKVGFTSGCFDLIHIGHASYLRRCRALCDFLVVGVDSDEMVRSAKGPSRPIIHETERVELVRQLRCVDEACLLRSLADLEHLFTKGELSDRPILFFKNQAWIGRSDIQGLGPHVTLCIVPDEPGLISTTEIIEKIWRSTCPSGG